MKYQLVHPGKKNKSPLFDIRRTATLTRRFEVVVSCNKRLSSVFTFKMEARTKTGKKRLENSGAGDKRSTSASKAPNVLRIKTKLAS